MALLVKTVEVCVACRVTAYCMQHEVNKFSLVERYQASIVVSPSCVLRRLPDRLFWRIGAICSGVPIHVRSTKPKGLKHARAERIRITAGPQNHPIYPKGGAHPSVRWTWIELIGPKKSTVMMCPIGERELISEKLYHGWIPYTQGPYFSACDPTAHQRSLFLDIALAYHAFLEGFSGVFPTDFTFLADRLELLPSQVDPKPGVSHEPQLLKLGQWLRGVLPASLFHGPHIPPVVAVQPRFKVVYSLHAGRLISPTAPPEAAKQANACIANEVLDGYLEDTWADDRAEDSDCSYEG
ncbi:hypothetical protein C8Q78DRAFT_496926 [Trametes maxima]|nr:hypothetical protein C8Q78DRAFT_496926 [Trametes maxima]